MESTLQFVDWYSYMMDKQNGKNPQGIPFFGSFRATPEVVGRFQYGIPIRCQVKDVPIGGVFMHVEPFDMDDECQVYMKVGMGITNEIRYLILGSGYVKENPRPEEEQTQDCFFWPLLHPQVFGDNTTFNAEPQ